MARKIPDFSESSPNELPRLAKLLECYLENECGVELEDGEYIYVNGVDVLFEEGELTLPHGTVDVKFDIRNYEVCAGELLETVLCSDRDGVPMRDIGQE